MADPKIRFDILANAEGEQDVARLAAELGKLDDAIDPAAAQRARALADELRSLGAQQQAVQRFAELRRETDAARAALDGAQLAAQKVGRELAGIETPTRAQAGQMQKLGDAVRAAKAELLAKTIALDASRAGLSTFGIATDILAKAELGLRSALQATRAEVQQLGAQQQAVQRFQELGAATETARARLAAADAALEGFRAEMAGVVEPTRAQAQQLAKLSEAARQSQLAFAAQAQAQAQAGAALRAAGVDTERLASAQSRNRSETTATAAAAQRLAAAYGAQGTAATQSANTQAGSHRRIRDGIDSISSSLGRLQNLSIAGILGGQTAQLLKSVGETADAYSNLSARVRLVTGDGANFQAAMEGIFEVAKRTSSSLDSTATLFTRIAQAGKEIGLGQKEALALTESINQAIQLSGGSAASADAAITQFIQGLQSGVLRGEEFNSVMEQAPRLARALEAGLHLTTAEMRDLAKEGKLTAATVIQALRSQAEVLDKEFRLLPATLGRAVTNLGTEWTKFIGSLNSGTGATAAIAGGINALAANLDNIAGIAQRVGAVLVVALAIKGASALRSFAIEIVAAAGSANLLSASISKLPSVINITIAAVGFEIAFRIGEMLHENSALARQLGVGITAFFANLVNDLRLLAEAAAAVFSDDTIGSAFDRYRQRGREMDETFRDMWQEAEKAPERIGSAADKAADATQQLGGAAQASSAQISSAAGTAASGVQGIGSAAATSQQAILALAKAAGANLPTVGVTAAQQAAGLAALAAKSREAGDVLANELPAAIDKLAGAELDKFRAAFASALGDTISQSRRLAAELQAGGQSGQQALAQAERAGALLQRVLADVGTQAAQSLGVDVAASSQRVSDEFQQASDTLSVLVRTLPQLRAAGVDTATVVAQALAKMIDGAKNQAELDLIMGRLKALATEGVIGPDAVAGAMQQAADKADALKQKLDEATPGVQGLAEAARKAGVDIGELTTGLSKGFKDSVQDVAKLTEEIQKSGTNAERAGPLLSAAIDQRIAAAKTKEELELLARVIEDMGTKGPLAGSRVSAALDQIKRKAEELSPALKQAQADAQRLGITLQDNIQQGAEAGVDGAIRAYERLKLSGKASAAEVQAAFAGMAGEVIRANQGIVPEWLKVEAALRGVVIELDEFGNACVRAARAGEQAGAVIARGFENVAVAIGKARGELDVFSAAGIKARNAQMAAEGLADDARRDAFNLAGSAGQANDVIFELQARRAAGGLAAGDLAAAQAAFDAAQSNLTMGQRNQGAFSFEGFADLQAKYRQARAILDEVSALALPNLTPSQLVDAELQRLAQARTSAIPVPAPAPAGQQSGAPGSTVNITVGANRYTVPTTGAGANALVGALEAAARNAGALSY